LLPVKLSMNNALKTAAQNFNALTLRERLLTAVTIVVSISVVWWFFYVEPLQIKTNILAEENNRINKENKLSRNTINDIRNKIAGGLNKDKSRKLAQLELALKSVEERLRLKTIELIDPDQMFQLMTSLVYRESGLKLLSLKRLKVKPAIEPSEDQRDVAGIYRHVLEVKFSGKFLDILKYMQTLENLDWKLIWDEIEIATNEFPQISVKIVISTLSTRKEWVGV
jgi:MSHA biogenesis protein MshJ